MATSGYTAYTLVADCSRVNRLTAHPSYQQRRRSRDRRTMLTVFEVKKEIRAYLRKVKILTNHGCQPYHRRRVASEIVAKQLR